MKAWGEYHLLCTIYSADVNFQVRVPNGTWQNASRAGSEITLTAAGEIAEIQLIPEYEYRCSTGSAGSVVVIAPYTIKYNANP